LAHHHGNAAAVARAAVGGAQGVAAVGGEAPEALRLRQIGGAAKASSGERGRGNG